MLKLPIELFQSSITSAEELNNLGVTFGSENTFDNPIHKVGHACYCHLRDL